MASYSTPVPSRIQHSSPPPPSQYPTPLSAYDSPSISTPPVPPPKQTTQLASTSRTIEQTPPPVPPPPRASSRQAPSWPGHDRDPWSDGQYEDSRTERSRAQPTYEAQSQHDTRQRGPLMPSEGWVPDVLLEKSKNDLHGLLNDPQLLSSLLHHPDHTPAILTASVQPLHTQLTANASLASSLSSLESELQQLRESTSSHVLATRGLEANWRKKQKDMEVKLEAWSPRELYNRLGAVIAEGEGNCRAVEEGWVDDGRGVASEREVAEWVRRVREGRRIVALRKERRKRWDEGRVGGWR